MHLQARIWGHSAEAGLTMEEQVEQSEVSENRANEPNELIECIHLPDVTLHLVYVECPALVETHTLDRGQAQRAHK